ncbi:RES family NAD+ phosphorylase [Enterovirga aerilata]|uniref:RES family NAD+ phosphorylase n=1 Tax=Enterovirga aerilata TaxID=2730920 RepID=A0A849I5S5_9HYPH|nr:RES family NAD+ phosphorylase [Enterovirga sp. DB1703]NNM72681.1 RES family NAD+ phosphorylase [Enterovirga sp. DB1703]
MRSWRLCREPYADLSGEGARLNGGRWNRPGRPLIYTADNAALAALEVRVHLDLPPDLLPDDYVLLELDLGEASVEGIDAPPADPAAFGSDWLASARSAVLRVPSAIVPECSNLLINPLHPEAGTIRVARKRRFAFDPRLWAS